MKNKNKSKTTFPPAQAHSWISYLLYFEWCKEIGVGSCSQFRILCLCCCFLSMLFPCPLVVPTHMREFMNFSNVVVSHRLHFCNSCSSMGPFHSVPSGMAWPVPAQVTCGITGTAGKTAWCGVSMGCVASFSAFHVLWHVVLHRLKVESAPSWTSMGCRTMDSPMGHITRATEAGNRRSGRTNDKLKLFWFFF